MHVSPTPCILGRCEVDPPDVPSQRPRGICRVPSQLTVCLNLPSTDLSAELRDAYHEAQVHTKTVRWQRVIGQDHLLPQ